MKFFKNIIAGLLITASVVCTQPFSVLAVTLPDNQGVEEYIPETEPEETIPEEIQEQTPEEQPLEEQPLEEQPFQEQQEDSIATDRLIEDVTRSDSGVQNAFDSWNDNIATNSNVVTNTSIEQNGEMSCSITDIEISGNIATVTYSADTDASIIVSVFDNENEYMVANGTADVLCNQDTAEITISQGTMPDYYYLRAYIVDTKTLKPLSQVYISNYYTQSIQEFLATTIEDYDAERVMSLASDEQPDNENFAVVDDDVEIVICNPDEVLVDESTQTAEGDVGIFGDLLSFGHQEVNPVWGYSTNELIVSALFRGISPKKKSPGCHMTTETLWF